MSYIDYGITDTVESQPTDAGELTTPSNLAGSAAVLADLLLLTGAVTCAVTANTWWLSAFASVIGGTAISTLFILGHEAAHGVLFTSKPVNQLMSRLLFLPCLHNSTLWLYQHNHLHHQQTNVQGANSFSPMTLAEYRKASRGRRMLERIYRSPLGFGLYYLVERWWKHKFFPRTSNAPKSLRIRALRDFRFIVLAVIGVTALVGWNANFTGHSSLRDIFFGIVLPFYVWNHLMGFTAFVQHTHPRAGWTRARPSRRNNAWQLDVTVCVKFPRWYDLLSHNIMHHPAHHENPRVPWYRLVEIERRIASSSPNAMIVERFNLQYLIQTARRCKLFDFENNCWTDFQGRRTS